LYFVPLQKASFYFDDRSAIVNNEVIKKIDLPAIFNAFNTRFLPGFSFALNYKWCGLHPAGYRFINVLIHCFNAFLIYLLIKKIATSPFGLLAMTQTFATLASFAVNGSWYITRNIARDAPNSWRVCTPKDCRRRPYRRLWNISGRMVSFVIIAGYSLIWMIPKARGIVF
jgi:hypothetical protein